MPVWHPHLFLKPVSSIKQRFGQLLLIVAATCLGLVGLYAAFGFWLAPWLLQTYLLPQISQSLNSQISLQALHIDPFGLSAEAEGLQWKTAADESLLSAQSLEFNLEGVASLAARKVVAVIAAQQPVVALRREKSGEWNWQKLFGTGESAGEPPLIVDEVRIEQGEIDFQDFSPELAVAVKVQGLNLTLERKAEEAALAYDFSLEARVNGDAVASAIGEFHQEPLAVDGSGHLVDFALAPWAGYFNDLLPWPLVSGKAEAKLDFHYSSAENLNLQSQLLNFKGIELKAGTDWLKFVSAQLRIMTLSLQENQLKLNGLEVERLDSPWMQCKVLQGEQFTLPLGDEAMTLNSAKLQALASYGIEAEKLEARQLAFDSRKGRISVGSAEALGNAGFGHKLAKLFGSQLVYSLNQAQLEIPALKAEGLSSAAINLKSAEGKSLIYQFKLGLLMLEKLTAETLKTSALNVGVLAAEKLQFAQSEGKISLGASTLEELRSGWLKLARLRATSANYQLNTEAFQLQSAQLEGLVADMKAEDKQTSQLETSPISAYAGAAKPVLAHKDIARIVKVNRVMLAGLYGSLQQRVLRVDSLLSEEGELGARLTNQRVLQILGLPNFGEAVDAKRENAKPWLVQIEDLKLDQFAFGFLDEAVTPAVRLDFSPTRLQMKGFSTEPKQSFQISLDSGVGKKGQIQFSGKASLFPLRSKLKVNVTQLRLRALQSYWQDKVGFEVEKGRINLDGELSLRQEPKMDFKYAGSMAITEFKSVDLKDHKPLINWNNLQLDGLAVSSKRKQFQLEKAQAIQPFVKVFITESGKLNLAQDIWVGGQREPVKPAIGPEAKDEPWFWEIKEVKLKEGQMLFMDQTIKPSVVLVIDGMTGQVTGLNSKPSEMADLFLAGMINGAAPVKITGRLSPTQPSHQADINMEFRNVSLTTLSPYSMKFAGYRIEKGKLNMDLRYVLKNRQLEASNRMTLDQLTLGEKVDNQSSSALPLDLAVALLKDSNGQIDVDLPITGNLDDPQFSLSSLYGLAAKQFLMKIVSSPFSLFSNLIQSGPETAGEVVFKAGQAEIPKETKDKLRKLAEVLKQKPSVSLDIKAMADPDLDRRALAEQALLRQLQNDRVVELRASGQSGSRTNIPELSQEDYHRLFSLYYQKNHSGSAAGVLQGEAYRQAKAEVIEQWKITEVELRFLAQARAYTIREFMTNETGLAGTRIYLLDTVVKSTEDGQIRALLTLTGS